MIYDEKYDFAKINLEDLTKFDFAKQQDSAILLSIYLQPNANETAIVGIHDSMLKIKIATVPVDGAANKAVRYFLLSINYLHGHYVFVTKYDCMSSLQVQKIHLQINMFLIL